MVRDCFLRRYAACACSDCTSKRYNLTSARIYTLTYLRLAIPALRERSYHSWHAFGESLSELNFPYVNRTAQDGMDRCFRILEFLEPEDEPGTKMTALASS